MVLMPVEPQAFWALPIGGESREHCSARGPPAALRWSCCAGVAPSVPHEPETLCEAPTPRVPGSDP